MATTAISQTSTTVLQSTQASLEVFASHPVEFKSNPVIGFFLDGLFDDVTTTLNAMIGNAKDAFMDAEMRAAQDLIRAIEALRNNLQDVIDKSINEVGKEVTDKLLDLEGLVEVFQQRNQDLIDKIAAKVQTIVNTLPWADKAPQVSSVTPHNIVINSTAKAKEEFKDSKLEIETEEISKKALTLGRVKITVSGNFPCSADPKFLPILEFNQQRFDIVQNETGMLAFEGPVSAVFLDSPNGTPLLSDDKYSYGVGKLQLPWDNTASLPWWKRWLGYTDTKTYVFRILEGALPLKPGDLTAIYSSLKEGQPIQQRFKSNPFHEDASHAYKEKKGRCKDWDKHHFTFSPDPGFKFVMGTQSINLHSGAHGNHYEKFTSVREDGLEVEIGMDACSGKHMGIINFHVEATEAKPTTNEVIRQDKIDLRWGGQKVVPLENNGTLKKIIFTPFDGGDTYEFSPATDLKNKYVKVVKKGDNLEVSALIPDNIAALKI